MMMTLGEAAERLTEHLGGVVKLGSPVTESQVLRFGVSGHLLICAPVDARCYSPTAFAKLDALAVPMEEWTKAATIDTCALYVVPPRFLFRLLVQDRVSLEYAISLDGKESIRPFTEIRRDTLFIVEPHFRAFAASALESFESGCDESLQQAPERDANGGADWTALARAYADEYWLQRPPNTNPSIADVAGKVYVRFANEGIQGPRGRLSAATIERQALRGWTKPTRKRPL